MYNGLLLALSPLLAALLVSRVLKGKSRAGWKERWGNIADRIPAKTGPRIWVHAASVGEVMAASPILSEIKSKLPTCDVVISVITPGGYETAWAMVGKVATGVVYAPFDVPFAVNRSIKAIDPELLLVMETEIWPNMLYMAHAHGSLVMLANGRISDRSIGRYRRLRLLFRWALSNFDAVLAQTPVDQHRLVDIGAPPERTRTFGNAKFDQAADKLNANEIKELRTSLRLPTDAPVLVVGSTRVIEEEREVIKAYIRAREALPDLTLIHAPRHVERANEVAGLMSTFGLSPVLRTEIDAEQGPISQIILNTFGELAKVYALGNAAYIGNSLLPPGGGQNLLQPLAQGVPVIYGPNMANFRDLAAMAETAGVGFRVNDADGLARKVVDLVQQLPLRSAMADRAIGLIQANRGAAAKYADEAIRLLNERARAKLNER